MISRQLDRALADPSSAARSWSRSPAVEHPSGAGRLAQNERIGRLSTTDGLRALAIIAVVLFHSFPSVAPGGFIGVDVFFVISGFIISFVYEESLADGRTKFRDFYVRRIKRLAPAYLVLVVTVSIAALLIMRPRDLVNYGWALIFQGFYGQNIAFWNIGDYFESALTKPLLHTWSLAVEEQFYLLFPIFIFAVARFRSWRNPLLIAAAAASLIIGWKVAAISPKTSFYWLPTRIWEFAAGILAAGVYRRVTIAGNGGKALVVGGTACILAAVFLFDQQSAMPSAQTILAVFGTAAVLLGQDAGFTRFYDAPLAQHFGRMSYSWYLWHWPPLALYFLAVEALPSFPVAVALALLGYGLGLLSFLYVERKAKALPWRPQQAFGLLLVFCVTAAASGIAILRSDGFVRPYPPKVRALLKAQLDVPSYRCPLLRRLKMWDRTVCSLNDLPGRPILLVGDSHADRYKTILSSMPLLITKQNCTAIEYGDRANCDWSALVQDARALNVSHVLLISLWSRHYTNQQYRRLEDNLRTIGISTVILLPTPDGPQFDPATYLKRGDFPEFTTVTATQVEQETGEFRNAIATMAKSNPNIVTVDPLPALCPGKCRFALGSTPIWRDDNHVTAEGAALLRPILSRSFMLPQSRRSH